MHPKMVSNGCNTSQTFFFVVRVTCIVKIVDELVEERCYFTSRTKHHLHVSANIAVEIFSHHARGGGNGPGDENEQDDPNDRVKNISCHYEWVECRCKLGTYVE